MEKTTVAHTKDAVFKPWDVPTFLKRDLRSADIVGGKYKLQVLRPAQGAAAASAWLGGDETFAMGYVLKGEVEVELEGVGRHRIKSHGVFHTRNGAVYRICSCNQDLELLHVATSDLVVPAPRGASVQHASDKEASFGQGQRKHALYRDLGIAKATAGAIGVHIGRVVPHAHELEHENAVWHTHDPDLQFVYVLDGVTTFEYEDIGSVQYEKDTAFYQPKLIRHLERGCSNDFAVMELTVPAKFRTQEVEPPEGAQGAAH